MTEPSSTSGPPTSLLHPTTRSIQTNMRLHRPDIISCDRIYSLRHHARCGPLQPIPARLVVKIDLTDDTVANCVNCSKVIQRGEETEKMFRYVSCGCVGLISPSWFPNSDCHLRCLVPIASVLRMNWRVPPTKSFDGSQCGRFTGSSVQSVLNGWFASNYSMRYAG